MKRILKNCIPFFVGLGIGLMLFATNGWPGFLLIFPWLGASITIGCLIAMNRKGKQKDIGRRIAVLLCAPVFLIFLGVMQKENLQLEETVFYILLFVYTGYFMRVLIHYAVAKVFGPLIWGRGFCGWACWTAAVLEWLPIRENRKLPPHPGWIRYAVFGLSLALPALFVWLGYDWVSMHINSAGGTTWFSLGKTGALIWFLVGNGVYYAVAIRLAFRYRKKRAFCKMVCPVSLVMKAQTTVAFIQKKPTGHECTSCGSCNRHCPMDVDVMSYISQNKKIRSSECILCGMCSNVCPQKAIL